MKLKLNLKDHLKQNSAGSAIHLLSLGPVAGDGTSYHPHISISAPGCWKLYKLPETESCKKRVDDIFGKTDAHL